jgi:outer membrane protein TolC
LVRNRSTSRASALAQVDRASAQARLALTSFYPTLTATGSVQQHLLFGRGVNFTATGLQSNVDIPDPSAVWSGRLAFRQPLLNLKSWHEHGTTEVAQRAAALRVEDVERLVLAAVADTIVAVVTAERLAEISRVSLRSSLSTLDLTRRRARLGASSAVDVLRAEQEVALNRAQLVAANEALRRSREALGMALGYPEAWGVTPEIRLDALGEDAQRVCQPVASIAQRADVRAAASDVEVARRNVDSPDFRLAPTLDMVSDLNYSTSANTANGRPLQWTVGALLTIPLFDAGIRSAEKQINGSQLLIAEQNLTQIKREAELEVVQATRSVTVAEVNFQVSQHSRDIAKETSRLARLSFLNGKGTSFELVDATRRYQQAELDLAVKEFEVVRARILALLARANCDI